MGWNVPYKIRQETFKKRIHKHTCSLSIQLRKVNASIIYFYSKRTIDDCELLSTPWKLLTRKRTNKRKEPFVSLKWSGKNTSIHTQAQSIPRHMESDHEQCFLISKGCIWKLGYTKKITRHEISTGIKVPRAFIIECRRRDALFTFY